MSELNLEALKNTTLFSISVKRWGNKARVRDLIAFEKYLKLRHAPDGQPVPDISLVTVEGGGADAPKRVSVSKTLVVSEALDQLNAYLTEAKAKALAYGMPSFIRPGSFVVKRELVPAVEELLEAAEREFRSVYLPSFLNAYPEAKRAAETAPVKLGGLGPIYNERDYPSEDKLRTKFGLKWNWFTLTVPEGLPPEIRKREEEKLRAQFEEAAQQMKDALRVMFAELIERAVDRLATQPGEKRKRFTDTLVTNIDEFFKTFEARNIMGDAELAALVDKAKSIMGGATVERLRADAGFRETVQNKLTAIDEALKPMIEEIEERAFDFSE